MQMLACMASHPSPPNAIAKGTLIIVPKALVEQRAMEIQKHVDKDILGPFVTYYGKGKLQGPGAAAVLQTAAIILTTYSGVARSYPNFNPPKEIIGFEKKMHWWKQYFLQQRGTLHQVVFYRVILDDAQQIKNRLTYTSKACRGLVAKHRWAMSSTPIQNSVQEVRTLRK
jgi:SNF2 family DNA or RNA helicase